MTNTFDKSVADIMNNLKFFNAKHDRKKYDNRGEMRATITFKDKRFEFIEYEIDGKLDRSADSGLRNGTCRDLVDFLDGLDHKDIKPIVIDYIYDKIEGYRHRTGQFLPFKKILVGQ